MNSSTFLACDLGAESGRVMRGRLDEKGVLVVEEIHRFANQPVAVTSSVRWDILGLFREMKIGLAKAVSSLEPGEDVVSLSVDTWGVDYAWLGGGQPLLALPYIYRDARIDAAYASALEVVPKETIFAATGLQFLPFNTVYQLFADHRDSPDLVKLADCFLPLADYFHFLFCGERKTEESLASTTQIYNPKTRGNGRRN
jgi:rhamnulokinase